MKKNFGTLITLLWIAAGINHFLMTKFYSAIVPTYLPHPLLLVLLSGAAEIAGGLGLLVPATRRVAAWSLIALLVAVFPANLEMVRHAEHFPRLPLWLLWLRLPLQLVFIWGMQRLYLAKLDHR